MNFAMVEKEALHNLDTLMATDVQAARLIVHLVRLMEPGDSGVVVVSRKALEEIMGVSESTVVRATNTLARGNWVHRIKVGSAWAFAINSSVAWVGDRQGSERAVFRATVVTSKREQDAAGLSTMPVKRIPIMKPNELPIPSGREPDPPVQKMLEGLEPALNLGEVEA
jgi:hypothetical protein